jgi:hypothetical protein
VVERLLGETEVAPAAPANLDDHEGRRGARVNRHEIELVATDMDVPGQDGPARIAQSSGNELLGGVTRQLSGRPTGRGARTVHARIMAAPSHPTINQGVAQPYLAMHPCFIRGPGPRRRAQGAHASPSAAMTIERPLAGGMYDDGRVVLVGDTVRRPMRASSVAAQALLIHLEAVGFDAAPRFLGVDERGREILTFVDGDVPLPPYPAWAMTDRAIAGLGTLLRRFHDARASFDAASVAGWSTTWSDPAGGPLVCHNDLFPENVVFRDGLPVALIDFGEAAPGRPTWDLAIAAEVWSPLSAPTGRIGQQRGLDAVRRVGLLAGGYGFERARAAELVEVLFEERAHSQTNMRAEVAAGDEVMVEYWRVHGGDAQAAADDAWLESQRAALIEAIANQRPWGPAGEANPTG